MLQRSFTFLLLFSASNAHGAFEVQCKTPADLIAETQVCTDNAVVLQRAQECKRQLDEAFRKAGPELSAIFDTEKGKYVLHQKHEMHYTNLDYQTAQAKLKHLIDEGTYNLDLMASYPPVLFDIAEEDTVDGGHEKCFTDNYGPIKELVEQLDDQVTQLKQAKAAADALQSVASTNDSHIENLDAGLAGKNVSVGSGDSRNAASDITGIKKEAERASHATETLSAAKFKAGEEAAVAAAKAAPAERDSTVTASADPVSYGNGTWAAHRQIVSSFHDELGGGAIGYAKAATAAGSTGTAKNEKHILQNEAAQRGADSIGALVWQTPSDLPDTAQLQAGLQISARAPASVDSAGNILPAGEAEAIAASEKKTDSFEIASAENDLFASVHDRYRKTELFRRARLLHVPLSAFESNLQ